MRHCTTLLLLLLAFAGCATPAPAQQATAPDGMHYAASTRGTVYYAVTCDAWTRLAPANLRFFRTAADARAAGLRPSTQPGCAMSSARTAGVPASGAAGSCVVARIIDGDTLVCDGGDRIRLLLIDEELLRAGVAVVSVHPPNVRHVERLRAAVVTARAGKVGLWATSAFDCAPADHRAGRC